MNPSGFGAGRATSEDEILACVDRHFPLAHPAVQLGRGDDCAIFKQDAHLCASADLFLENRHFRRAYFEPEDIGFKALAVNLSDIAAMGAKPVAFVLSLGLPQNLEITFLDRMFSGMAALAAEEDIALAGGDISAADRLLLSITVFGERPAGHSLLARGGAMNGDILFIIGTPGLAAVGFERLESGGRSALSEWPAACAAHLRPRPLTGAGLMLARAAYNSRPPTLMDVSDGLARDLPRLLGQNSPSSALGAEIEIPADTLHPEVLRHAELMGQDPAIAAFVGGEDYALLGACAQDMAPSLQAAIPGFRRLGRITSTGRILCNGRDVAGVTGFDHFAFRRSNYAR